VAKRTKKGNVTAEARKAHGVGKEKRFPIFDKKSAESALRLRGHSKTSSERASIITRAATFVPAKAKAAREADSKRKKDK